MFADDEDGIDGELVGAAAEGFGDGGIDLEAELGGAGLALVAGRFLVDVEGDDLHVRLVPAAFVRVADEEAVSHMLGVGEVLVDGGDDGDALH